MKLVRAIVVTALVVAVVAVAVWLVQSRLVRGVPETDEPESSAPADLGIPPRPEGAFPLTVTYVYDGDTIQARMPSPNDIVTTTAPIRIRLIGVDTPEGTPEPECWADEARAHLAELLPEGTTVWAAPDRDTWDDYDRRLFNLWTDDGRFVQWELVSAGDAEALRIAPNDFFYDLLRDAEAEARAAGAGRWGAC